MYGPRLIRKLRCGFLTSKARHHGTRPLRDDCRQDVKNQNRQVARGTIVTASRNRRNAEESGMRHAQASAVFRNGLANDRVHH